MIDLRKIFGKPCTRSFTVIGKVMTQVLSYISDQFDTPIDFFWANNDCLEISGENSPEISRPQRSDFGHMVCDRVTTLAKSGL